MAKTRGQRAKEFATKIKVNKIEKKSSKKTTTSINKKTNKQEEKSDVQDLLKLCRPFSICLERIDGRSNGKALYLHMLELLVFIV